MNINYLRFISALRILFWISILGLSILFISRVIFLFVYGDLIELSESWEDVIKAFIVGLRFDISALAMAMLPLAIISFIQLFTVGENKSNKFYMVFSLYYGLGLLLLITLVTITDFYFYKFFSTHLSVISFGIIEDDTTAVLSSVWSDYPIITIIVCVFFFFFLVFKLLKRLISKAPKKVHVNNPWLRVLVVILFVFVYVLSFRGSFGRPLNCREASISDNSFINTLTLNGCFALKVAYDEKRRYSIDTDIPKMLSQLGFKSGKEAVACYLEGKSVDTLDLLKNLISTTPLDTFLESNPPNVVFIQMESMNSHYFDLNTKETNTLGKLESVLPYCYVFRNFIHGGRLTIYSLEGLLVGSPIAPISQSEYRKQILSSSVAKPFKEHGYITSFISGNSLGWRNLDKFLGYQYIDSIEGKPSLLKRYSDAKAGEWGVPDEFTFKRIFEILSNKSGKAHFIYGFTISNHTPFDIPSTYKNYPLTITNDLKSRIKSSPEYAYKNLRAYQYANTCLGQFIEDVKNSPFGENTIIVATGDHTNPSLFEYSDKDLLKKFSIPLIVYLPDKYKPKHEVDTHKFGSHKDIFPTIFNLALSNTNYVNTGFNLFAENGCNNFGVYNCGVAMNSYGCVDFQSKPLFYRWTSDSKVSLESVTQNDSLDELHLKAKAYIGTMKYFIMSELSCKDNRE